MILIPSKREASKIAAKEALGKLSEMNNTNQKEL
jgi:hypothetical protein